MEPTPSLEHPNQANEDAYLDTVTLLQEEIERLEAELRLWTQVPVNPAPAATDPEIENEATRRINELTSLLDERDETIALLWEHLSAIEEAQAARSAEWEQLHHWVDELEHRLGDLDLSANDPGLEGPTIEDYQNQLDSQRRAWEQERHDLEAELARLRRRLDPEAGVSDNATLAELEDHNRRLRDECQRLLPFEAEVASLTDRVTLLQVQLEDAREQLRAYDVDLQNERLRHEAELAELRSGQSAPRFSASNLTPSERVRALREHLREVHAREVEERKERQLSTRIARLLRRTGARR